MRALLVVSLAVAGCGGPFSIDAPQGLQCSTDGHCPPGFTCVKSENMCRLHCTSNNDCMHANNGCSSGGGGSGGMSTCPPYGCDTDGWCRPSCGFGGGGGGACNTGPCGTGQVCDPANNICRQVCGSCPSGWGCTLLTSPGNPNPGVSCFGCRPMFSSPVKAASFAPAVAYGSASNSTSSLSLAALTAGGPLDVVVASTPSQAVWVYASHGDGTFGDPVSAANGVGNPQSLVVGDFNGDGKPDLVISGGNTYFVPGNGNRTFGAAKQLTPPGPPLQGIFAADFNQDGKLDLSGAGNNNSVTVWSGNGDGTFTTSVSFPITRNIVLTSAGNLDATSGPPDLVVGCNDGQGTVFVYKNPGDGKFTSGVTEPLNGVAGLNAVVVGDLNNDGANDIIATTGTNSVIVFMRDITKNMFKQPMTTPISGGHALATGDFNGDGNLDVVTADPMPTGMNGGKFRIDVLLGDGSGKLIWSGVAELSSTPQTLAAGDLNGDSKPDIVVGSNAGIAVLLNNTQ